MPFLDSLWTAMDEAVTLKDCDVYSYKSDGEDDPFGAASLQERENAPQAFHNRIEASADLLRYPVLGNTQGEHCRSKKDSMLCMLMTTRASVLSTELHLGGGLAMAWAIGE